MMSLDRKYEKELYFSCIDMGKIPRNILLATLSCYVHIQLQVG